MIYLPWQGGSVSENVLLLHFDGSFVDSSPKANAPTVNGIASTNTTSSKFGAGSYRGQGAGNFVTYPDAPWFNVSNDRVWSVDFWVYISSGVIISFAHNALFGKWSSTGNDNCWAVGLYFGDVLYYYDSSTGSNFEFRQITSALTRDTWNHVAIWIKPDKTLQSAVNGVLDISYTGDSGENFIFAGSAPVILGGGAAQYSSPFAGAMPSGVYVDELRICVDAIDYDSSNFTPPTTAYT